MGEENISQEFKLKKIYDERCNYLIEEIQQNELMGKKQRKQSICNPNLFTKHWYLVVWSMEKIQKVKPQKS